MHGPRPPQKKIEFGYHQFFTEMPSQFSVRCQTVCSIVYLNRQDFVKVLAEFPDDYVRALRPRAAFSAARVAI